MKVLIVDEEDIVRISLNDDLQDAKFKSTAVENGTLALEALELEYFDVVITDLKMNEMDGITLLKKIKKKHPSTMVIIMTASGSIESAIRAMKLGAYDYITKPFSSDELISTLKQIKKTI